MHPRRRPTVKRCSALARRIAVRVGLGVCCSLTAATPLSAHEIPERVAVRAFVQHDGTVLRLLVRVPLEAMRDVDFPLRADGSLDLVRARALLPEAAQTWIVNSLAISADGTPLATPRISGTRIALPNDRAFENPDSARASFLRAPLESEIIQWRQTLLDVALEYTVQIGRASCRERVSVLV